VTSGNDGSSGDPNFLCKILDFLHENLGFLRELAALKMYIAFRDEHSYAGLGVVALAEGGKQDSLLRRKMVP
jgi:hypothetical protein